MRAYDLDLTAKPATTRPVSTGKDTIQIVHFSDIHVDLNYTVGTSYNCSESVCCQAWSSDDAVGVTDYPCGANGNYACDAPKTLEQSMYDAIAKFAPDAAFGLFTGDVITGTVWETTDSLVVTDFDSSYGLMKSTLSGLTIFPATGNHDSSPVNNFPPSNIDNVTTYDNQWVYNNESSLWSSWIGSAAASEVQDYG